MFAMVEAAATTSHAGDVLVAVFALFCFVFNLVVGSLKLI